MIWKSYGVEVVVSTANIKTKEGCLELVKEASALGPVQSIFNLGVVLRDAVLENQTAADFKTSFEPKAYATKYLDEITREHCKDLRDFVVFSSVSCGRGNAGQTNYGMANSVMERICEKRKDDGYPALAIQWGAVGDVGLVAEMQESNTELVIGGTLQQKITNCLSVLDTFLRQDYPIVSSMVVAEKRSGSGQFVNAIDAVAQILGLRDVKIVSPHSTLPELGMDSIMAVEIKQILEQEYEIVLSPQEMRSLTFSKIQEMQKEKESGNVDIKKEKNLEETGFKIILSNFGSNPDNLVLDTLVEMKSSLEDGNGSEPVFLIPGVEGFAKSYELLASKLKAVTYCLQYIYEKGSKEEVMDIVNKLLPIIRENMGTATTFKIVAHSYGCIIALELIAILEKDGFTGKAIFVDGSPELIKDIAYSTIPTESDVYLETAVLCVLMSVYMQKDVIEAAKIQMLQCNSFQERLDAGLQYFSNNTDFSTDFLTLNLTSFVERIKSSLRYQKNFDKINAHIKLIKPKLATVKNYDEDYKLSLHCVNPIEILYIEGNHQTVLQDPELADCTNEFLDLKE